ncbi:MAG: hypothetical protein GEU90_01010 [Gemmatimonas sp.]|nr:hypothetical protein [Gemmatimonas sp.]
MNVGCPDCGTVYRVDPAKVPVAGVRARCVRCPSEFEVSVEERFSQPPQPATAAFVSASEGLESGAVGDGPKTVGLEGHDRDASVGAEWSGESSLGESETNATETATTASPGQTDANEQTLPPAPFGSADPDARARRLARALVSDIVVYHPDRREQSLKQGTIRQDFRSEISKSWDEYVDQVGNEMARKTSYFQAALNEILAGGARIF